MKTVIEMAREAGAIPICHQKPKEFAVVGNEALKRFAELVRADERKKWEDQTAVEIHEAVLDEREACAKVCHDASVPLPGELQSYAEWNALCLATTIRARGKASIRSNNDH